MTRLLSSSEQERWSRWRGQEGGGLRKEGCTADWTCRQGGLCGQGTVPWRQAQTLPLRNCTCPEGRAQAWVGTLSHTLPPHISGTFSESGEPVDMGSGGEMLGPGWEGGRIIGEGPRLKQPCTPWKILVPGASSEYLQSGHACHS